MASNKGTESRAAKTIREIFASGRPLTYIRSSEEQRVARVLREVAEGMGISVRTWSQTEGMEGAETPRAALDHIISHEGGGIFHLKDFHEALKESAEIRRRLRDLCGAAAPVSGFRMRMADQPHLAAALSPRQNRHDPDGGARRRRIPRRVCADACSRVAQPPRVRPSRRGRQNGARRSGQGGSEFMAHFRFGRSGADNLSN